jgi:uncharacterized BrkB/YihY/UPF0761 family membrane protein|uniref:Uncharacterized protein n=1 Tax=viral metagenome TaxID=1070528 RepID=A0A6C0EE88_9ZZZZ
MNNILQFNILNAEKIIKYILISFVIILCLKYIPENPLQTKDAIIVSFAASIIYAVMDMISPTIKIYNNKSNSCIKL